MDNFHLLVQIILISFLPLASSLSLMEMEERYLSLVRHSLLGLTHGTIERSVIPGAFSYEPSLGVLGIEIEQTKPLSKAARLHGEDWPLIGLTMIGTKRLEHVETGLRDVVKRGIAGDFIECGVWRGGGSIYARAVLDVLGQSERRVFVADSFEGLPSAETNKDTDFWTSLHYLPTSLEVVKENFQNFGLLGENVKFVKGYFKHSLPRVRGKLNQLAFIRADGDMYSSTMDILFNLYSRLSIGGIIFFDDAPLIPACVEAIEDFRHWHHINDTLIHIDPPFTGVYWEKTKAVEIQVERYYGGATTLQLRLYPL